MLKGPGKWHLPRHSKIESAEFGGGCDRLFGVMCKARRHTRTSEVVPFLGNRAASGFVERRPCARWAGLLAQRISGALSGLPERELGDARLVAWLETDFD